METYYRLATLEDIQERLITAEKKQRQAASN